MSHNLTQESSYVELATKIQELKAEEQKLKKATKAVKDALEDIQVNILPAKMENEGMSSIQVKGIGRLTVQPQFRVSVVAARKHDMQKWLEENGWEEMIQETVNSSTLKAWAKERLEAGDEIPTDCLNMHSFDQVTLTKK